MFWFFIRRSKTADLVWNLVYIILETSRFHSKYLKDLKIRLPKWHVVSKDTEVEQPTGERRPQRGRLHSIRQVGVGTQTLSM